MPCPALTIFGTMGVGASLLKHSMVGVALSGVVWWAGFGLRRSFLPAVQEQAPLIRRESFVESDSRKSHRRKKKECKKSECVTAEELMRMGICYGEQGRLGKAMGKFLEAKGAFEDERAMECAGYANLLAQIGIWYGMRHQKKRRWTSTWRPKECTGRLGPAHRGSMPVSSRTWESGSWSKVSALACFVLLSVSSITERTVRVIISIIPLWAPMIKASCQKPWRNSRKQRRSMSRPALHERPTTQAGFPDSPQDLSVLCA